MTNLNQELLFTIPDNSGKMQYDIDKISNNLLDFTKNFDIVKNNSGKLEIKQNNSQLTNTIHLTFSDI